MEGLEKHLPGQVKAYIADHNIKFYTIDGIKIGKEIGLGGRINTVLQSAFFKLAAIIPEEEAIDLMKKAAKATYGRKGDKIVQMNYDAIDAGAKQVHEVEVPESWKSCPDEGLFAPEVKGGRDDVVSFVKNIQTKVNSQEGNSLPVSAFNDYVDGSTPSGSSAYEKRGIAVDIPVWKAENCIQCNRCAYVCPHAVIRPVALTEEELAKAPEGTTGYRHDRYAGNEVHHDSIRLRLYRMRFLCKCLPGQEGREGSRYGEHGSKRSFSGSI